MARIIATLLAGTLSLGLLGGCTGTHGADHRQLSATPYSDGGGGGGGGEGGGGY